MQVPIGPDATTDSEIQQGKALINENVKHNVTHSVYSSVKRSGDEASWSNPTPVGHFQTKYHIEHHLRDHAGSMGWTVLRPVGFMDNLAPGFPHKVFLVALRDTLGVKKTQYIATADIGISTARSFIQSSGITTRSGWLATR